MKVRCRNGVPPIKSATIKTGIQTKADPISPIFITIKNGMAARMPIVPMRTIGAANQR